MYPLPFLRVRRPFVPSFLLGALLAGCNGTTPIDETPPPPVTVSEPVVRKITERDDFEGRIAAAKRVEVRARVRGHLTKVNFVEGKIVTEGELLYEIDARPYQASLDGAEAKLKAAEANLALASAEFKRESFLASQKATSARELDVWAAKESVAKAEILKGKAGVEDAKLDLEFTKIKAPITGKISRTQVDVGNLVNTGGGEKLLTTIVAIDPMFVFFNVDERALARYRQVYGKGKEKGEAPLTVADLKIPVYVGLEGEQDHPHKGVIDFTDNQVNPGTGTISVRGVLNNASRVFDDGMRARVQVPIGDPYEAIMVTERALGTDQGRKYVYVVNAKNFVERRDVTPGRVEEGLQVILEGLQPGELVIVNGIQRVRDGMEVRPQKGPMPGAK